MGIYYLKFLKQTGLRVAVYCIVNLVLLNEFSSFYVHGPNILSDHCLIEFSLFSMYRRPAHIDTSNEQEGLKYFKWNS